MCPVSWSFVVYSVEFKHKKQPGTFPELQRRLCLNHSSSEGGSGNSVKGRFSPHLQEFSSASLPDSEGTRRTNRTPTPSHLQNNITHFHVCLLRGKSPPYSSVLLPFLPFPPHRWALCATTHLSMAMFVGTSQIKGTEVIHLLKVSIRCTRPVPTTTRSHKRSEPPQRTTCFL